MSDVVFNQRYVSQDTYSENTHILSSNQKWKNPLKVIEFNV